MRLLSVVLLFISIGSVIGWRCYQCNSDNQKEGKKCVENFEPYLKICAQKLFGGKSHAPIGCRKSEQYIGDQFTLIRECAYSGEDMQNKRNKGSMGVSRTVNQCSDKHGCNESPRLGSLLAILSIITSLFLAQL